MPRFSSWVVCLRHVLAVILLACASPLAVRAQAVPPGEGSVADTTELRVLRQLYATTGGPQWKNHTKWLTGTTLTEAATWYGVGVSGGDVLSLSLGGNSLQGPLPAAIGELRALQALFLQSNSLTGPLPESLGQCTNLVLLYVSQNQLSGPLPASLGNLAALQQFGADHNAFDGALPTSLGRLQQLWMLSLGNNRFSGRIPGAWGRMQGLSQLGLNFNRLTGPLPDSLALSRNLLYLQAAGNAITGPIPTSYKRFRHLIQLDFSNNQLSGELPDSLHADFVYLTHNQLDGAVPASYSATISTQLQLGYNDLTGLPDFGQPLGYPNLMLSVGNNRLAFDAFEPNQNEPGVYQLWDGQQLPGPTDTLVVVAGQVPAQPFDGAIGGMYNHYQWQREVGGQLVDLPGDTLVTHGWGAVTPADAGLYRARVTNRWVVGVALYSKSYYLDVTPYPAFTRNRPDDTNTGLAIATPLAAPDASAAAVNDMNFVRTWAPRVAITDSVQVRQASFDAVAMSTTYLDGLGRPLQTVQRQASPNRLDVVQPQAYDELGREPKQYLPYVAKADNFHSSQGYYYQALSDQTQFYSRTTPVGGGAGPLAPNDVVQGVARTGRAFAETVFEASPLNRVVAQGAAGEAWQVGNGHVVERVERPNTAADSVLRFQPGYTSGVVDPGYQGFYAPGELWGTDVADAHGPNEVGAHGYRTIEWKDKQGQVVLRQVEANRTGTAANIHSRWLRTAYAYDDFGHLRYVVQPEGVKAILVALNAQTPQLVSGGTLPSTTAPFLFHYRYDGRGRQIAKQVPGTDGETLVVYDQLDRPVLSQDAAQRARREWNWSKYDALGRVVLSGLVVRGDTAGQVTLQNLADTYTDPANQYEQRTADTQFPYFYTTNQSFPKLGQNNFGNGLVLSATYYDDYNFNNDAAGVADASYNTSADSQFPSGTAPVADALRTTGLTTRTQTRVLGAAGDSKLAEWLVTTTFYDERARPIQVQTTNARKNTATGLAFTDLITTQLDFTGKVVKSVAVHEGPNHTPITVAEFFTYDHTGRVLTTSHQLPGDAQPVQLTSVAYNELGQVAKKTMGTSRLAQQVDYAYNIRGWLTQLNDPYHPQANDLFNLSLHYEQGFTKGYEQYNGNLTGQTWRARDGVQRAYGYVYDPLNRIFQGDYVARRLTAPATPNTGAWDAEQDRYRLNFVSYDDNGNILTLRRRGLLQNGTHATPKQFGPVDQLTYAYQGNRLQAVDDAVTGNQLPRPLNYNGAPASLAGDFQEAETHQAQEYLYDANGNLTQDRNKGITGIAYNHLNLPRQIHFGIGADSVVFRYTAGGQKVAKLVYQTGHTQPERTDYLGPFQYEGDSLRFFPHAEGRVLRSVSYDAAHQPLTRYEREFSFKDHLGNLRLAYRLGHVIRDSVSLEQDTASHTHESQQFDSLSVSTPIAQNVGSSIARTGSYVARLNAGGTAPQPLGPLKQMAVQKGDTVTVTAYGLYPQAVQHNFLFTLASFLTSILHPANGAPTTGLDPSRGRAGLPLLQVGVAAGLVSIPQLSGGVPKGYLRVLVFNADSALVSTHTRQLRSTALNNYDSLRLRVIVPQDGYVTAYVGNESDVDVLFDDITVELRQGVQVQETEYDPAGLELAGLGTSTPGLKSLSQYKFNGKEFQTDLGLNWNHQDWRFFDPQILRWHVGDPEIENGQESWTPYSFGYDNAVRYADADGRCPGGCPPTQATVSQHKPNAAESLSNTVAVTSNIPSLSGLSLLTGVAYGIVNQAHVYATGFFDREKATTLEGHTVNRNEYAMAGFNTLMTLGSFALGGPKTVATSEAGPEVAEIAATDVNWKGKIEGTAQKTGTPGHQFRSYREAIDAAKDPNVEKVFLDKGYNRVAGTKAAGNPRVSPNRRPDVSIVKKNGQIDAVEVPSKTDNPATLLQRNRVAMKQLPIKQQGQVRVEPIR